MTPDLASRKIIVAAYCYYVLDNPVMTDAQYDKLSIIVAEGWDELDPVRQWQLESAAATRAGGHHIKFTAFSVSAAYYQHSLFHRQYATRPLPTEWKEREDGLRYVTATG